MTKIALMLLIGYFILMTLVLMVFLVSKKYEARKLKKLEAQKLFDANEAGAKAFKEVFGKEPTGNNKPKKK